MERDCNQGHLGDTRHAQPEMTARKTPGANAIRVAWILVLRKAVSSKAGCVTRAWLEQEVQNQQLHPGEVRPDDGMQRMREQNDWGRCEATLE